MPTPAWRHLDGVCTGHATCEKVPSGSIRTLFRAYEVRVTSPLPLASILLRKSVATINKMAKVLFADDDPLLHQVLGFKLTQQKWEFIPAFDGDEAVRLAKSAKPDLIILDGMMPVKDGFAALRELRQEPGTSKIPVIMLSAKNRDADVVGALDEGADDYLTKPFSPAELIARITKYLPKKNA